MNQLDIRARIMLGRTGFLIIFGLFFLLLVIRLSPLLYRNYASQVALHSLESGETGQLQDALRILSSEDGRSCSTAWLTGFVLQALGETQLRDHEWVRAMQCSPAFVELTRTILPEDQQMAATAIEAHPDLAESWFWLAQLISRESPVDAVDLYWHGLGLDVDDNSAWLALANLLASFDDETALDILGRFSNENATEDRQRLQVELMFILARILSENEPERAIQLYREGLKSQPLDAVRWYELGDVLAGVNPELAIEAYLKSCYLGDPGNHGCYGAGRVAENLGDLQLAIKYYRLSDWEEAMLRANQLEQELH